MSQVATQRSALRLFNRGVQEGIAPIVGQTVQSDQNAAISANVSGVFSHNGWLFGESSSSTTELLVAQNGFITRDGAASDIGFNGSYYTSTSAGVYMQVIGTRVQLTVSSVVGSFVPGDIVRQATSNAVGRYVRTSGSTMVLALVSGTFNGSNSIAGEDYTSPAIGTNALTNPEFAGAVAGSPGTAPTSWPYAIATGSLGVSGEVLTFTGTAQRISIGQTQSVEVGTYEFSVDAEMLSGTGTVWNTCHTAAPPAGSTLSYFADGVPTTNSAAWSGARTLMVRLVVTTPGTVSLRCGMGNNGNSTTSVTITNPRFIKVA